MNKNQRRTWPKRVLTIKENSTINIFRSNNTAKKITTTNNLHNKHGENRRREWEESARSAGAAVLRSLDLTFNKLWNHSGLAAALVCLWLDVYSQHLAAFTSVFWWDSGWYRRYLHPPPAWRLVDPLLQLTPTQRPPLLFFWFFLN